MAIGIILGVVFAVLSLIGVGIFRISVDDEKPVSSALSGIFTLVMIACFAIVPFSFRTVDTGEVAVVKHFGKAKEIREAGTHFDIWFANSYQRYDSKVQNVDIETAAYSSDAQTMNIQMTLQYQIVEDKVMEIAKQYGSLEILQNRIQSISIEKTKAVLSSYKAMNIISDRSGISPAVETAIKEAIGNEYFVNVAAVVLTNIDFSDAFELAVEEKMIAEQNQLKAEYENKTKVAQAESEAKAKLVAAEADAKTKIVAAEAEAEANELLEKSLTDKILQEMYINKWNGKLPSVVADGSSMSMILPSDSSDVAE